MGAALEHFTRALHAFEGLAGADPDNAQHQRGVAAALELVGELLADRGEVGAALEHHTRALHTFERLAGADPDNPHYQHDVARALNRVGDLLARRGEVGAALDHHTRALHIAERLAAADLDSPHYQRDAAVIAFIGEVSEVVGAFELIHHEFGDRARRWRFGAARVVAGIQFRLGG